MNRITYESCDYINPAHKKALLALMDHYMSDPMGNTPSLSEIQQLALIEGLRNHPSSLVLFILCNNEIEGMAVCFINFSTFKVKPYLYIHDLIIYKKLRGKGLGRLLLNELIRISEDRGYCKLTLEVREDNPAAQSLYINLGFKDCEPPMWFWTKQL
ncbi:MAG: GNAT family N-acetyltransferase [Tannerellaceae bacterium]|nr:GNAT family N-acetyltransferase [Tannerellaceae bacterium]